MSQGSRRNLPGELAVGFYSGYVFPCLLDCLMDRPHIARQRRALLAGAEGQVLEIGVGTGLNLPHYPTDLGRLTVVEPNASMRPRAQRRSQRCGIELKWHALGGERLPLPDESFDCVVSTWTLCSIPDPLQAVLQIRRVLRPGGRFLFLEHGASPDPNVRRWQQRLNWLEGKLGAGCRLDVDVCDVVRRAGFDAGRIERFYLEKTLKTHGYMYRGVLPKPLD